MVPQPELNRGRGFQHGAAFTGRGLQGGVTDGHERRRKDSLMLRVSDNTV
jgi:hypothetical protein